MLHKAFGKGGLILGLLGAALAAHAQDVVFSCTTANGKHLSITKSAKGYDYRFGKKSQPELAFVVKQDQAELGACTASNGDGSESYITLPNGGYVYSVSAGGDRYSKIPYQPYATLKVTRPGNDKAVATLACRPNTVINNIFQQQSVSTRC